VGIKEEEIKKDPAAMLDDGHAQAPRVQEKDVFDNGINLILVTN
jgi:hypothetical protein